MLVDSGSPTSFVSERLSDQLELTSELKASNEHFKAANNGPMKIKGMVPINFTANRMSLCLDFTVGEVGELNGILGADFIDEYCKSTNWVEGMMHTVNGGITMHKEESNT